jgi:hypothetical protein
MRVGTGSGHNIDDEVKERDWGRGSTLNKAITGDSQLRTLHYSISI